MIGLVQSTIANEEQTEVAAETLPRAKHADQDSHSTPVPSPTPEKKNPTRKLTEEARAVGHVARDVWATYIKATGGFGYWVLFMLIFVVAALSPVLENGWVSYWSRGDGSKSAVYYITVYAIVSVSDAHIVKPS
jgi:hypothetical protein